MREICEGLLFRDRFTKTLRQQNFKKRIVCPKNLPPIHHSQGECGFSNRFPSIVINSLRENVCMNAGHETLVKWW